MNAISVKELAMHIKSSLESAFKDIRVKGETTGVKKHISGHIYFSLKEDGYLIDCIIWRSVKMPFSLTDGAEVVCAGSVTTYADRSKYQLIVREIQYSGIGALLKIIEDRRIKLQKEGLFDVNRKKPIPKFPRLIGIATSPTGAVIHDMMHRIAERYPCKVLLYPIAVQGDKMPIDAIKAISYFQGTAVDFIILARGGGSFEDLIGFNDEAVVRAVAGSNKPIISAIGHETDVTLCDHAADLRAPTPTAAIELCTPDKCDLLKLIKEWLNQIEHIGVQAIKSFDQVLDFGKIYKPDYFLVNIGQKIDYLYIHLQNAIHRRLEHLKQIMVSLPKPMLNKYAILHQLKDLMHLAIQNELARLDLIMTSNKKTIRALSYKETLKRGYCRAYNKTGTISTAIKALDTENFTIEFSEGKVEVQALSKK